MVGAGLAVGDGLDPLGLAEADGLAAGVEVVKAPGGVTVTSAQPAARKRATDDMNRRGRADTADHDTRPTPGDRTFRSSS